MPLTHGGEGFAVGGVFHGCVVVNPFFFYEFAEGEGEGAHAFLWHPTDFKGYRNTGSVAATVKAGLCTCGGGSLGR